MTALSSFEDRLLATALEAAEAAAGVHRRWAGKVRTAEPVAKGISDFVSRVDLEAQEAALEVIRAAFPDHRILAEEEDGRTGSSSATATPDEQGARWIVDPLDGTTNFLHGHPTYASSVAVEVDGQGVAGAVVAAATDERWWALRGDGAFRNGTRIRTSSVRELAGSLVGTGFPFKHRGEIPAYLVELGRVLGASSGVRRGGSAALDLCYLAQGSLDAFWERWLAPWDVAAGLVILSEAGGVATRARGAPIRTADPGPVRAANSPELLAALETLLDPPEEEGAAED